MTTMPMKIEDNLNVDEVMFASVDEADLSLFLNRYYALRVNIDDRIRERHYFEGTPGLLHIGPCVFDDKHINLYEIRIPENDDASVNNTARYGYSFLYKGILYSLDYEQLGHFTKLRARVDDVPQYSDIELWIEFMEFLNDYYPSES
jgi:hypothetical protein